MLQKPKVLLLFFQSWVAEATMSVQRSRLALPRSVETLVMTRHV